MAQKEVIKLEGRIVEALPNTQFKVELQNEVESNFGYLIKIESDLRIMLLEYFK